MVARLNAPLSPIGALVRRARSRLSAAWANPWLRAAANTTVGLISLVLLLRTVPLSEVAHHLQPRHLSPLLAIVLFTVLSQVARATRWMLLLRARTRVGLLDALWINLATQLANYLLPLRAGEALRLWWLAKRRHQPAVASIGLIVTDHAFDLGGVTAVLGAGTLLKLLAPDTRLPALPALLVVLGMAAAALAVIAGGGGVGPRLAGGGPPRRWLRPSGGQ